MRREPRWKMTLVSPFAWLTVGQTSLVGLVAGPVAAWAAVAPSLKLIVLRREKAACLAVGDVVATAGGLLVTAAGTAGVSVALAECLLRMGCAVVGGSGRCCRSSPTCLQNESRSPRLSTLSSCVSAFENLRGIVVHCCRCCCFFFFFLGGGGWGEGQRPGESGEQTRQTRLCSC